MPNTTGTANTAVDLMVALNTHLTANGWTKLLGETDQVPVSPKSARYWRVWCIYPQNLSNFIEVELLHLRTTVGGANVATNAANWTISNAASGTAADLISGTTPVRSVSLTNSKAMVFTYDFGTATVVREVSMKSDTGTEAPRRLHIEWSNDNITWTRMWSTEEEGEITTWANDETREFTFDDAYLNSDHYSSSYCRRAGDRSDPLFRADHGVFAWQGPGYDAARRVYINLTPSFDLSQSTEWLIIGAGTSFDSGSIAPYADGALGADISVSPKMILPLGPFTYWIYSNDLRVIIIVKNGIDDYLMMYAGFMKAFALPEDYGFPLLTAGGSNAFAAVSSSNASYSVPVDPGSIGDFRWRRWDGTWITGANRQNDAGQADLYSALPGSYTWPYHSGANGDGTMPGCIMGDNDTFQQHWMERVVPTAQNESFMWPVIVMSQTYGAVGAMDGCYAIPRAGLYTAEQVLTISSVDYKIFKNRNRSKEHNYFAIRVD